jgi:hypothetical protein
VDDEPVILQVMVGFEAAHDIARAVGEEAWTSIDKSSRT